MKTQYKEILTLEHLNELLNQYCSEHELEPEMENILNIIKSKSDFVFEEIDGYNLKFEILWKKEVERHIQEFNNAWNKYYDSPYMLKELLRRLRLQRIKKLEIEWIELRKDSINLIKNYCEVQCEEDFDVNYYKRIKYKKLAKLFYEEVERICTYNENQIIMRYNSKCLLNDQRESLIKTRQNELKEYLNRNYFDDLNFMKEYVIADYCNKNKIKNEVIQLLNILANVSCNIPHFIIRTVHLKAIENSNVSVIVDSYKSHYEEKIKIKPIESDFIDYLVCNVDEVYDLRNDSLKRYLADFMVYEKEKMDLYDMDAKFKQQTLIDITPQQTLSIETTSAHVEENKEEMTFDDLFPSIDDKEMVMKMLIALKIINSEDKYLLGTKTGIIRVFIDVMKEEGYFNDIDRKPILRIFTPVILGRRIEVINEPANFDVIKNRILIKLKELRK